MQSSSRHVPPALSSASSRYGQQTVLARLQGLFPNLPPTPGQTPPNSAPSTGGTSSAHSGPERPPPQFLKVRIMTWNMHDSVPKGDLDELLGTISPYQPSQPPSGAGRLPSLPADTSHPYHIVVIAGQECPSLSGIPMGLGAGFKLIDKDKDKDKDKDWDKDKEKDKDKARERDKDYDKPRSKHKEKDPGDLSRARKHADDSPYDSPVVNHASGWTSLIEDWLCNGIGAVTPQSPTSAASNLVSPSSRSMRSEANKEKRKGPYQLLIKERMMGIYLAVYINRDIRGLVRGTSRSAVTAGLIGGRVGNKGGVGISINLDGTTLLFMNCHLAAHEGKVHHRLANLAKIKAELSVDDFLAPEDPRVMAEDLTDKFDFTFLCGDLNFRLDITRLHADWLISRQDYAQALAFDQLKNLMRNGQAFVGFQEAPINFPPTFKYDVLRTIKRAKWRSSKISQTKYSAEKIPRLTEVDEVELEEGEDDDADEDAGEEAASMASSAWTSMHSRAGTEADDDDYFQTSPSSQALSTPGSRASIVAAAHKAKTKWLSLVSANNPASPTNWLKIKQSVSEPLIARNSTPLGSVEITVDEQPSIASIPETSKTGLLRPVAIARLSSTSKSLVPSEEIEQDADDDGVYDSSHKKRVPSWCDRILWKSTVVPDSDSEDEDEPPDHQARPRTRLSQFFNAFRPLARSRRESASSVATVSTIPQMESPSSSEEEEEVLDNAIPFSRQVPPRASAAKLRLSRSIDAFPVTAKRRPPTPTRATDLEICRTFSMTSSPGAPESLSPRSSPPSRSPSLVRPALPPRPLLPPRPRTAAAFIDSTRSTDVAPSLHPRDAAPLHTASRWRFFPFLRDAPQVSTPPERPPSPEVDKPRKGDVICLSYTTLDNRGMRRLEGRSDHRPVIGSYAVYL